MRAHQHPRMVHERVAGRRRLGIDHVQRRAAEAAGVQRGEQRVLVDQLAAAHVHHARAARQPGQQRGVDDGRRAARVRQVQREHVGAVRQRLAVEPLHPRRPVRGRHAGVVRGDAAEEPGRQPGGVAADAAEPEQTEGQRRGPPRRLGDVHPPVPRAHVAVEARQLAHERQGHRDRVHGDVLRRHRRHVGDPDAALRRGVDVDHVDADRQRGQQPQARQPVEQRRVDVQVADQQRGGAGRGFGDPLGVGRAEPVDVPAGVTQRTLAGVDDEALPVGVDGHRGRRVCHRANHTSAPGTPSAQR